LKIQIFFEGRNITKVKCVLNANDKYKKLAELTLNCFWTGKEVPSAESGGQDERESADSGGEVQALCI